MQNPMGGRNRGKENAEELAEGHADGGDGSGLNDQKQSPAVEKSPERSERFAQINVLAAGARHHGGEFAIAERGDDGHEAAATAQAAISSAGESTSRAISAETMKMPEPIIEPMTSMVALVRPRPLTSSLS